MRIPFFRSRTSEDPPPSATESRARKARRHRTIRQAAQLFFLALFVFIVLGSHGIPTATGWRVASPIPPETLFLLDPLTYLGATIASRTLIAQSIVLILILAGATLIWGRVFCGWICPLGTVIDISGRYLRPRRLELRASRERKTGRADKPLGEFLSPRTKYYILFFIFVLALFGVNTAGWLDPLAILLRGTAFALVPAGEYVFENSLGKWVYRGGVFDVILPWYLWLRDTATAPFPHAYAQAALHLGILLGVLALSRIRRRYWCNVLCPLGAFWGLLARVGIYKRRVVPARCNECSTCALVCRMEAVPMKAAATVDPSECVWCLECAAACPKAGIEFTRRPSDPEAWQERTAPDLTRRGVLGAIGASMLAYPLFKLRSSAAAAGGGEADIPLALDAHLLRPPGARPEDQFLQLCIRCGECYRICPQNALHPLLFQAGADGLWTPAVVPRLGYCEPSCTLCAEVCPTTALRTMSAKDKLVRGRIGTAEFDRARCIPWARGMDCSVCEEMCPVAPKAIRLRNVTVIDEVGRTVRIRAPIVLEDRCIGCGICENKCPLEGASAVRVVRRSENRHQSVSSPSGYGY